MRVGDIIVAICDRRVEPAWERHELGGIIREYTGTGTGTGEKQQEQDGQGDVTQLSVLRGHQVVGCASFRCATGALSDVVVRPSARRSQVGRALVESAREKAREAGTKLLAVWPSTEEGRTFFIRLGFKRDGDGGDNGKGTTPSRMILTP